MEKNEYLKDGEAYFTSKLWEKYREQTENGGIKKISKEKEKEIALSVLNDISKTPLASDTKFIDGVLKGYERITNERF